MVALTSAIVVLLAFAVPGRHPPPRVTITFVYSNDAKDLLGGLIDEFNGLPFTARDGVFVRKLVLPSGRAETRIKNGLKADAWMPASSLWARVLNHDVGDQQWAPTDARPVAISRTYSAVVSPEVIAMWDGAATQLGWSPERPSISWDRILRLAVSHEVLPGFGPFKMGQSNPDSSTSGLFATISEFYAATHSSEDISQAQVSAARTNAKIRTFERSLAHYEPKASDFCAPMAKYGERYVTAVYMQETTLISCNKTLANTPGRERLDAIYPKEGTFAADYPYLALTAPWVSPNEHAGAQYFGDWLRHKVTNTAGGLGFRLPSNPDQPPGPLGARGGPATWRGAPNDLKALDDMRAAWVRDRKPANIVLVAGGSDDSDGEALRQALSCPSSDASKFFGNVSDGDRLGLIQAGVTVRPLAPVALYAKRRILCRTIDSMSPTGSVRLYDALARGWRELRTLHDRTRINAVVVVIDSPDAGSRTSVGALENRCLSQTPASLDRVRVFTVAYGHAFDSSALQEIATPCGGSFSSSLASLPSVYASITSDF